MYQLQRTNRLSVFWSILFVILILFPINHNADEKRRMKLQRNTVEYSSVVIKTISGGQQCTLSRSNCLTFQNKKLQHLVGKSRRVNSGDWENLMRKHIILQSLCTCFSFNLRLDRPLLFHCGCRCRWQHRKTLSLCMMTLAWRFKETQKATDASQSH